MQAFQIESSSERYFSTILIVAVCFRPRRGKLYSSQAYTVYEHGAQLGLFLSAYQRSTHNVDGIRARPWWTAEQTGYGKQLKVLREIEHEDKEKRNSTLKSNLHKHINKHFMVRT